MSKQNVQLISFVVPVFNEHESLKELARGIATHVQGLTSAYEIIFVDDGSTDDSARVVTTMASSDRRIRLVQFATNCGKAEALTEGFRRARGEIIITMDGDLQDDPVEIPNL